MRRHRSFCLAVSAAVVLHTGCRESDHASGETPRRHEAVSTNLDSTPSPVRFDSLEPGVLHSVMREPVEDWIGPGGRSFSVALRTGAPETGYARRFGTVTRGIVLRVRAPALTQHPCGACHQGRKVVLSERRIADAHQNIQPQHPERIGGLCPTCHLPDNVGQLAVRGGPPASLDQSYRLCAQCHFAQADSWAGGAHGKRLDGWEGQRVLMACTDCHDPHAPAAEQRIPFQAPQIQRVRGPLP